MQAVPVKTEQAERLRVKVYASRREMGAAAAADVADRMRELLGRQPQVRIVFAAAPSQNEFLESLIAEPGVDWNRVAAFHMDEYIGLPAQAPQRFGRFLEERLFRHVRPGNVHLIDGLGDPEAECRRYGELVRTAPIDIICLGIGENGHIAFNDPPVADFDDPVPMKPVELDEACRRQQVNDGCFPSLEEVPRRALTLTIPTMMSGKRLFCIVPGANKRDAVARTLHGPVSTDCPASILRRHPDCTLYTDLDAYGADAP